MAIPLKSPTTPTTPTTPKTTPTGGTTVPADSKADPLAGYREKLQKTAASTREATQLSQIDTSALRKQAESLTGNRTYGYDQTLLAGTLVDQAESQIVGQKQKAEKAADALELVGEATFRNAEALARSQEGIKQHLGNINEAFNSAAEQADEYVQAARGRVSETLDRLDVIHKDFQESRSFAKAHSMQAATQSVLGSMKSEERGISQTYGANSAEMAQFKQQKQSALGQMHSNIRAQYQQLAEAQHNTYMSTVADVSTKQNMYLGFQEQQHVDMLKFMDQSKQAYKLQATELDVGIEQMKMVGMENLANWMISTPTYTMDLTPIVSLMSVMQSTEQASADASYLANKEAEAMGGGGGFDWGGLVGTGIGAMFGGVGAGIGGAIGSSLTGGGKKKSGGRSPVIPPKTLKQIQNR